MKSYAVTTLFGVAALLGGTFVLVRTDLLDAEAYGYLPGIIMIGIAINGARVYFGSEKNK